jgi:hypothetical protein
MSQNRVRMIWDWVHFFGSRLETENVYAFPQLRLLHRR